MSAPWTEAHQREALRRTYEIAAESVGANGSDASGFAMVSEVETREERLWRDTLGQFIDGKRMEREVARVRALAEGRLVRVRSERCYIANAHPKHCPACGEAIRGALADDDEANDEPSLESQRELALAADADQRLDEERSDIDGR